MINSIKLVWSSIKWFFTEIMNMYSSNPSFFSKKRVESGIAFFIAEWGMVHWLINKYPDMSTSDFGLWAAIQLASAGYIVTQIQKEKASITSSENNSHEESH